MFKINRYGKISCILGVAAFALCFLAAYSNQHWVEDIENQHLSLVINYILLPFVYLINLFSDQKEYTGPTMQATPAVYVFEQDAVIVFFVAGVILSIISLYFVLKSLNRKEYSFWYANGAFASVLALFALHVFAGIIYLVMSLALARRAQKPVMRD